MPTSQEVNMMLNSYGVDPAMVDNAARSFTMSNIIAWLIFGFIGFLAFNYGRKEKSIKPMVIGGVLMVYPYFVSNTIVLYVVGVVVTSLLYFWRD